MRLCPFHVFCVLLSTRIWHFMAREIFGLQIMSIRSDHHFTWHCLQKGQTLLEIFGLNFYYDSHFANHNKLVSFYRGGTKYLVLGGNGLPQVGGRYPLSSASPNQVSSAKLTILTTMGKNVGKRTHWKMRKPLVSFLTRTLIIKTKHCMQKYQNSHMMQ